MKNENKLIVTSPDVRTAAVQLVGLTVARVIIEKTVVSIEFDGGASITVSGVPNGDVAIDVLSG